MTGVLFYSIMTLIQMNTMTDRIQYDWGWCINVSDKTVDVVKSSYGEDTIVKTLEWIEGYSYEEMVEFFFLIRELKGYSFIETNLM